MQTENRQKATDKGVQFAYKQLQYARAHKAEMDFQFDVAESNKKDAQKMVWAAERAFEEASNELFERQGKTLVEQEAA